eukprot:CAMPEP_0177630662 /NCGR_PEP_ID=MMETSP0447-20121125/1332_1 /TAXON_ID=0 /ORGANISM="Stygamoeba regulata, Strain BSH-02190019" /LENGTH=591 /DNA_ID=CAMNT_0019132087 /DNA_START=27 /DNA_END=1802 /DNA_ORIENTATION=-
MPPAPHAVSTHSHLSTERTAAVPQSVGISLMVPSLDAVESAASSPDAIGLSSATCFSASAPAASHQLDQGDHSAATTEALNSASSFTPTAEEQERAAHCECGNFVLLPRRSISDADQSVGNSTVPPPDSSSSAFSTTSSMSTSTDAQSFGVSSPMLSSSCSSAPNSSFSSASGASSSPSSAVGNGSLTTTSNFPAHVVAPTAETVLGDSSLSSLSSSAAAAASSPSTSSASSASSASLATSSAAATASAAIAAAAAAAALTENTNRALPMSATPSSHNQRRSSTLCEFCRNQARYSTPYELTLRRLTCTKCGETKLSQFLGNGACHACYARERFSDSKVCRACDQEKSGYFRSDGTCHSCVERERRSELRCCSRCGEMKRGQFRKRDGRCYACCEFERQNTQTRFCRHCQKQKSGRFRRDGSCEACYRVRLRSRKHPCALCKQMKSGSLSPLGMCSACEQQPPAECMTPGSCSMCCTEREGPFFADHVCRHCWEIVCKAQEARVPRRKRLRLDSAPAEQPPPTSPIGVPTAPQANLLTPAGATLSSAASDRDVSSSASSHSPSTTVSSSEQGSASSLISRAQDGDLSGVNP